MVGGQEMFDFSTLDGLRAWRDFVIAAQREHHCSGGCPIGSLGGQLAETDPDARAHIAEGFKRWEATIQNGLREMHTRGELTPDTEPDTLALALLAALQGGLLLTQVKRDTKPLEAALDAMIELVARLGGSSS
jgi:TetR/AcrR family transcriptional regulator, transcriptional repressor for nem operon